jgi:hypothetical protein
MSPYLVASPSDRSPHASFGLAEAEFARLRDDLLGAELLSTDHATVERVLQERGTEVLRLLFEGWCNERVASEAPRDVTGADEVRRTHHRDATREVESVFGTVHVTRDRVGARGADALAPADAVLNLPEDRFTFGMRQRVAEEAARGSFEAAASAASSTTGAAVAKRQAEELALFASVDFDAFYEEGSCADGELPATMLVVLTVDGKGIVMRSEGLRDGTRKAAAKGTTKLKKRLSKGEKANRKRMATVAAVYYQEPVPRTSEEILRNLDGEPAKARPKPQRKRVFASVKKTAQQVVGEVFDEAARRDPTHQHRWVALVDGNKTQIQEIRAAAKAAGVEVTLVLDIIHVTEYLWSAAWDFHAEGDPAAEKLVRKYLRQILAGRASTVAAAIRRSATSRKLEKRTNTDKAAAYFLGKKELMRYDEYLRDGLPIATGVIEGACRHLVKDRMDITGARWGLEGAEAVLRLRSLRVSGDLDRYWAFHRAREFERNHRSRYAEQEDEWLARVAA